MKRYLHSLFCDDIRQEVGNKLSFMGVYQSVLYLPALPAQLQKLCISFTASTMADDPFRSLTFVVMRNDEVVVEHQLPSDDLERMAAQGPPDDIPGPNGQRVQTIHAFIIMPNLKIEEPCIFRVRARTEREEIKAPGLIVSTETQ